MLFLMSLSFIAILGFLAQTSGLCLVRGLSEALSGKPLFLLAILFSGAFAWLTIALADWIGMPPAFISFQFSIFAVIGGFLFGLGAVFNDGCGVSTISKLAGGRMTMLATIVGWLIGWVLLVQFVPPAEVSSFSLSSEWHFGGLIAISIFVCGLLWWLPSEMRKIWLMMLAIGLMASLVFLVEPKWTPSSFLKDLSLSFWPNSDLLIPSWHRTALLIALLLGMASAALYKKSFKFMWLSWRDAMLHLLAGILMGVGAAIASGGNDIQLLLALPSFSPAGITTVMFILVGIFIGNKISAAFLKLAKFPVS